MTTSTSNAKPSKRPASQRWRSALLPSSGTIKDAIGCLEQSALQIALVVSENETLIGTVTDGDIRRGLLRGLDLGASVTAVMKKDPLIVPQEMVRETVLQLMQANVINAIPVLDACRRVTGLHVLNELLVSADRPNMMVIMAGGRGVRLKPKTENCPKPLLPVAGKPMLEHIIERAKLDGFSRFVLAVHYLGHMIEEYFEDGSRWGVCIDYVREAEPLGTAGALSLLSPMPDTAFVVSNGDVLTDIRYGELLDFHSQHEAMATMAVRLHEWQHPFGVVMTRGVDITGFQEKPITRTHINAGIYVLDPKVLRFLEPNRVCDMPSLFMRLKDHSERAIVYPMHEPWLDVGRIDDLMRAENGEHQIRR